MLRVVTTVSNDHGGGGGGYSGEHDTYDKHIDDKFEIFYSHKLNL